jgi:hypothetical protein
MQHLFFTMQQARQVKQLTDISGNSFTLQRDNLASGLYYFQLIQNNQIVAADKLTMTDK